MKILLVDDEKYLVAVLKDLIEASFEEAEVETVFDGIDAVISITEEKFDCIITDHKMEKMNGAEFIINMKTIESSKNKATPTIVLSGFIPMAESKLADYSDIHYMNKPFNADILINKISEITGNKIS